MGGHRRGPWSNQEDQFLMRLVELHGPLNWVQIAQTLGSRTPKQCRERYHQNLKPTLNHHPISAEEGAEIERLVQLHGKRWAEIARQLNGRSDNAVKNWWNGHQNRRKRRSRDSSDPHYGESWSPSSADPASGSSTMTAAASHPPGLTLPPPTAHSYYARRDPHGYGPGRPAPSWVDPPLPSPSTSESAESDHNTNYTISSTNPPMASPNTVELPPIKTLPRHDAARLPSFESFDATSPSRHCSSHPTQTHAQAHVLPACQPSPTKQRVELLTAPNSPEYHQQQQYQLQQLQHQQGGSYGTHTPSPPKDPRLSVASLLAPERRTSQG